MTVPESDDELLAECDVDTYRAGGPGGQHVNKRETAVRLTHRPTGVVVTCQEGRSQFRNKELALERLRGRLEKREERDAPRVPTKMPRSAKRRIRKSKEIHSQKKQLRKNPKLPPE